MNIKVSHVLRSSIVNPPFLISLSTFLQLDEIDVRLIDWQGTRYGSPAIDLSYFLFCCADSKVRVELPKILDFYHEELIKRITELGSDGAKLFSHSNLEGHMKKYARFGLGTHEVVVIENFEKDSRFFLVTFSRNGNSNTSCHNL